MLEFKIQINNGVLVNINTPIDFEKTDFNLTRSKDLHSVTSSFAGNKASFVFQKDIHNNVFNDIISEYETKGFNADIKLFIYYDNNLVFDGIFDFVEAETDMVNTIKCQVVKKDKLFYLEKNKSVDVNIYSPYNLDNEIAGIILDSKHLRLPSASIRKYSKWEDNNKVYRRSLVGRRSFNHIRTQIEYGIQDSLNWLRADNRMDPYQGYLQQLVSAKENLNNTEIKINYSSDSTVTLKIGNDNFFTLWLLYGEEKTEDESYQDWANRINRINVNTTPLYENVETSLYTNYNTIIDNLPIGSGIWVFWECSGELEFNIKNSSIEITADSTTYPSTSESFTYIDIIKNVVKKVANINNVVFNIDWYKNTYVINTNTLRKSLTKPNEMLIKWDDIKKQLNERNLGCYYVEETDTLVFDHRSSILGYNSLGNFGDLAKEGSFSVYEDNNFVVNKLAYKYNKFQSLKENAVPNNLDTIHGLSEWYINNKGYEGNISVELPFVRDSYTIEDIRRQALIYNDDTSTSEDNTIILVEAEQYNVNKFYNQSLYLNTSFEDGIQTLINDGSFSFRRMIGGQSGISINNDLYQYYIISVTDSTLILGTSSTDEYNGFNYIDLKWNAGAALEATLTNGRLNEKFSVRQNIEYWKQTLQATNYYNSIPIINTLYKENKQAVVNGLSELADIITAGGLHTPRVIESKVIISVSDYFYLSKNRIGYITIYNSRNEEVNIYLDELNATFIDGCERMEANLKGWLKIDLPDYLNFIITEGRINDLIISGLNFEFNDLTQTINILDRTGFILYKNITPNRICSSELCFTAYQHAKNYLLSL